LGAALPLIAFYALSLIAIYLYTKFYLNANSSFKVICRTRYQTDEKNLKKNSKETDRLTNTLYSYRMQSKFAYFCKLLSFPKRF